MANIPTSKIVEVPGLYGAVILVNVVGSGGPSPHPPLGRP